MAREQAILPLIRDADRQRLLPDMQEGLDKIVAAIEDNNGNGTGEITLKLKIKSTSPGVYALASSLKIVVPEPKRAEMVTFFDETSGELVRRDPRQPDLPGVTTLEQRSRDQQ